MYGYNSENIRIYQNDLQIYYATLHKANIWFYFNTAY